MARIKLFEKHTSDKKMEEDLEDMLVELQDIGMTVRVQSPDELGYSFILINQKETQITELNNLNLDYSATKDEFYMKDDDGNYILDINTLIDINKPIFQSIFQMVMEYIMDRNNPTLVKIVYKEPFSQSVVKDVHGRFVNDEFLGIDVTNPYDVLVKIIEGKRLSKLEIYFRELYNT